MSCRLCGSSVHPSCTPYQKNVLNRLTSRGWTCDGCKTCLLCSKLLDDDRDFVICDSCDQGAHLGCLKKKVKPKVWRCSVCVEVEGDVVVNGEDNLHNGVGENEEGCKVEIDHEKHVNGEKSLRKNPSRKAKESNKSSGESSDSEDEIKFKTDSEPKGEQIRNALISWDFIISLFLQV